MATSFTPPRRRELWRRQLMRKWSDLSNTGNNRDTPLGFEDELTALRSDLEELEQDEQRVLEQDFGSVASGLRGVMKTSLLRAQSETLRQQFIEHRQYRVAVHTWNVAGKPPPDNLDMEGWIHNDSLPADIYVFGFQEVVPLNANNVLCMQNEGPAALWEAKIHETLNKSVTQQQALQRIMSVPLSTRNDAVDVTVAEVPEVSDVERLIAELSNLIPEDPVSHGTAIKPDQLSSRKMAQNGDSRQLMYTRVTSKQMVGLFITVWIRSPLWHHVHNVQVSTVGCGLMNHLGNKGSISVSMFLHYTSFCFVCSHLTAGHKEGDALRRNGDIAEIIRRTKFPRLAKLLGLGLPERILAHDRVIWLGDLNYRLALPDKETWTLVKRGDWASLLRYDQLKLEQGEGRVFPDWQEGPICFPPTYKFLDGSDHYFSPGDGVNPDSEATASSSKRRSPAWCDRVLWFGKGLNQLDYMQEDSKLSDHRSVSATFMVEVEVVSLKKLKKACVYPVNDEMDVHCKVVPMVKPFVDVHNLQSNKAWVSLLKTLSPQPHKLQEMEINRNQSGLLDQDVWFDAHKEDEDENVAILTPR